MDNAVALVRAYLHVNGYFTVTEYPVVEAMRSGDYRMATDLDVLAFRFPGAGCLVPGRHGRHEQVLETDSALGTSREQADMLIGEVKEGRAELNRGARNPEVLRAVLTRFGCCAPEQVPAVVERLLRHGQGLTASGHRVRLVAFGTTTDDPGSGYETIALGQVIQFLQEYLHQHWPVLRHAQFKDPALGFLMTLKKSQRAEKEVP